MPHRKIARSGFLAALALLVSACLPLSEPPAATALAQQPVPASESINTPQPPTLASPVEPTLETFTSEPSPPQSTDPAAPVSEPETPAAPAPTDTATQPPVDPLATPSATRYLTRTPTATRTRWPTRTPTITPTPAVPVGYLYIEKPGPFSKVTSPINLTAFIIPGANHSMRLEIIGEDGRPIVRELVRYPGIIPGARFMINPQIEFEIPGVSESALLRLSVEDPQGRTIAVTSMDLVLLSIGDSETNRVADLLTPYFITSPREEAVIEGGSLFIRGKLRPVNDQPIILELIADSGAILGSRQLAVELSTNGEHTPFETDIPYNITAPTWARLVLRQPATRFPGDLALMSVLVYLKP